MVKYSRLCRKDQIPPQDLWNGYDLQGENSHYLPHTYDDYNNASLVDLLMRCNKILIRRIENFSLSRKLKISILVPETMLVQSL
jgi:hypothetical protein